MKLNEFFQKVYCITLELAAGSSHPERLIAARSEFEKHGIEVEFVQGIDGRILDIPEPPSSDGDSVVRKTDMGCTLSHLMIAEKALKAGLKNYLVFEDDVMLKEGFNDHFSSYISQLKNDWDLLYLGGNNNGVPLEMVSENIGRCRQTYTTHAYGVNWPVMQKLVQVLRQHEKVDLCVSSLQRDHKCYIFQPHIAGQRPAYSYIQGKEVEYDFLKV